MEGRMVEVQMVGEVVFWRPKELRERDLRVVTVRMID